MSSRPSSTASAATTTPNARTEPSAAGPQPPPTPLDPKPSRPARSPCPPTPGCAHARLRRDVIDPSGVITLRYNSRLHHIGLGRRHAGTRVLVLVLDRHIRVLVQTTGQLLRQLTLDPSRDYQPQAQK